MTGRGQDSFFHIALSQAVSQCQWRPESPCGLPVGRISGSSPASTSFASSISSFTLLAQKSRMPHHRCNWHWAAVLILGRRIGRTCRKRSPVARVVVSQWSCSVDRRFDSLSSRDLQSENIPRCTEPLDWEVQRNC